MWTEKLTFASYANRPNATFEIDAAKAAHFLTFVNRKEGIENDTRPSGELYHLA